LGQEKDKLAMALRTRTTEFEDIRVKVGKLEQDNYRARELEANYNETQVTLKGNLESDEYDNG
jgi:hypothetical protein